MCSYKGTQISHIKLDIIVERTQDCQHARKFVQNLMHYYNILQTSILLSLALGCACTASIKPIQPFAPKDDAASLCKALEDNKHMDNEAIIQILSTRTYNQRKQIVETFDKSCPKKSLVSQLKKNLSGLFGDVISALLTSLPEFYVREMYWEQYRVHRPTNAILDILTTSSDKEIQDLNDTFKRLKFSTNSLADVLKYKYRTEDLQLDFVYEFFEKKRIRFTETNTHKNEIFNATRAAVWFHNIGDKKNALTRVRGDERRTVVIFRQWSIDEVRAILKAYEGLYHQEFEKAFEQRGFAEDTEQVRVLKSTPLYFADRLYDILRGSKGTDDRSLIRIIVGRSEIDLDDIKKKFEVKYGRSLKSVIESKDRDTNYLHTLTAILGPGK